MSELTIAQRVCLVLTSVGFMIGGTLHFIYPKQYARIMPPYLPWHSILVAVSGFFEIIGGLGMIVAPVRRAAALGLVALLVAVFPANIYMAANSAATGAVNIPPLLLWLRLPLQFVFIGAVLWCSKPHAVR